VIENGLVRASGHKENESSSLSIHVSCPQVGDSWRTRTPNLLIRSHGNAVFSCSFRADIVSNASSFCMPLHGAKGLLALMFSPPENCPPFPITEIVPSLQKYRYVSRTPFRGSFTNSVWRRNSRKQSLQQCCNRVSRESRKWSPEIRGSRLICLPDHSWCSAYHRSRCLTACLDNGTQL
jgi:hypothetical protein